MCRVLTVTVYLYLLFIFPFQISILYNARGTDFIFRCSMLFIDTIVLHLCNP